MSPARITPDGAHAFGSKSFQKQPGLTQMVHFSIFRTGILIKFPNVEDITPE